MSLLALLPLLCAPALAGEAHPEELPRLLQVVEGRFGPEVLDDRGERVRARDLALAFGDRSLSAREKRRSRVHTSLGLTGVIAAGPLMTLGLLVRDGAPTAALVGAGLTVGVGGIALLATRKGDNAGRIYTDEEVSRYVARHNAALVAVAVEEEALLLGRSSGPSSPSDEGLVAQWDEAQELDTMWTTSEGTEAAAPREEPDPEALAAEAAQLEQARFDEEVDRERRRIARDVAARSLLLEKRGQRLWLSTGAGRDLTVEETARLLGDAGHERLVAMKAKRRMGGAAGLAIGAMATVGGVAYLADGKAETAGMGGAMLASGLLSACIGTTVLATTPRSARTVGTEQELEALVERNNRARAAELEVRMDAVEGQVLERFDGTEVAPQASWTPAPASPPARPFSAQLVVSPTSIGLTGTF